MAATYLTLVECRAQVNIKDDTFTEDDAYLQVLAEAAEISVAARINQELEDLEVSAGTIDLALKQAILFLVATWYKVRENIVTGTIVTSLPYTMDDLLQDYIKRAIA